MLCTVDEIAAANCPNVGCPLNKLPFDNLAAGVAEPLEQTGAK